MEKVINQLFVGLIAWMAVPPATVIANQDWQVERTPWDDPDLQGN